MSLIIETDLGHDPDDLFAILWLLAAGVDIRAILITPGDPDQIAIARLLVDETGRDIAIGASGLQRTKLSSGSVHHALLKRYGRSLTGEPDGLGAEVLARRVRRQGDELLVIGPLTNIRGYRSLYGADRWPFERATMQGGFVPYHWHDPIVRLEVFIGKDMMPTFNLNGDRRGAELFLQAPFRRQMVGKNVCHTIVLDPFQQGVHFAPPLNRAAELFLEAVSLLGRPKRFHDPVAAVCHLYPEVGVWFKGQTVKSGEGWTTLPGGDDVLVDLNRAAFWSHIYNWGVTS